MPGDVKVFCVSVDQKMVGAHEFGSLVEAVGELHSIIHDLKRSRQEKLCREIYDIFNASRLNLSCWMAMLQRQSWFSTMFLFR